MTNIRRYFLSFAALILIGGLPDLAAAQQTPRTLIPTSRSLEIVPDREAKKNLSSIQTETLDQIGYDSIGIVPQTSYFQPRSPYWGTTTGQTAQALIQALPTDYHSAPLKNFAKEILLFPAPTDQTSFKDLSPNQLLLARLQKLYDLGAIDEINTLYRQTTSILTQEKFAKIWVNTQILSGDTKDFCQLVDHYTAASQDPFWLRLETYCLLESGDTPKADLTLQMLYESDPEAEKYGKLLAPIFGGTPQTAETATSALTITTASELLFLLESGRDLTYVQFPNNAAFLKLVLGSFPANSLAQLSYADRLARTGDLSAQHLQDIWADYPESKINLKHLLALPKSKATSADFAALYTAIMIEPQNSIRVKLVQKFIEVTPPTGSYTEIYPLLISRIDPNEITEKYSPSFIVALSLSKNHPNLWRKWVQIGHASTNLSQEEMAIIDLLDKLHTNDLPLNNSLTNEKIQTLLELLYQNNICQAENLYYLFSNLGFRLSIPPLNSKILKSFDPAMDQSGVCDNFTYNFNKTLKRSTYINDSIDKNRFLEAAFLTVLLEKTNFPEKKSNSSLPETIIAMYELHQIKVANTLLIEMLASIFNQIILTP